MVTLVIVVDPLMLLSRKVDTIYSDLLLLLLLLMLLPLLLLFFYDSEFPVLLELVDAVYIALFILKVELAVEIDVDDSG